MQTSPSDTCQLRANRLDRCMQVYAKPLVVPRFWEGATTALYCMRPDLLGPGPLRNLISHALPVAPCRACTQGANPPTPAPDATSPAPDPRCQDGRRDTPHAHTTARTHLPGDALGRHALQPRAKGQPLHMGRRHRVGAHGQACHADVAASPAGARGGQHAAKAYVRHEPAAAGRGDRVGPRACAATPGATRLLLLLLCAAAAAAERRVCTDEGAGAGSGPERRHQLVQAGVLRHRPRPRAFDRRTRSRSRSRGQPARRGADGAPRVRAAAADVDRVAQRVLEGPHPRQR